MEIGASFFALNDIERHFSEIRKAFFWDKLDNMFELDIPLLFVPKRPLSYRVRTTTLSRVVTNQLSSFLQWTFTFRLSHKSTFAGIFYKILATVLDIVHSVWHIIFNLSFLVIKYQIVICQPNHIFNIISKYQIYGSTFRNFK